MFDESMDILAVVIGNTNTRFARFLGKEPSDAGRVANADLPQLVSQLERLASGMDSGEKSSVIIASDNPPVAAKLVDLLIPKLSHEIFQIGVDMEVPIPRALDADARPGQDRLLNALAAFDTLGQACVVVDAGTAITVDFVDGQGTFQGGAIAPGATMMLRALHAGTASLPQVELASPEATSPFGKNTQQAMLHGVYFGIRGMVRLLAEQYAVAYEAYPVVIATGSDAPFLFEGDELIERIVPDLTLRGVEVACRRLAAAE